MQRRGRCRDGGLGLVRLGGRAMRGVGVGVLPESGIAVRRSKSESARDENLKFDARRI